MEKKSIYDKIEGARVTLRPIDWENVIEDSQKIVDWMADPDVEEALKYFSFFQKETTMGRQLQYFTRMIRSQSDQVFVAETKAGEFLGTCGLHDIDPVNRNLRIGIIIFNKHCWKQGYGKSILNLILQFVFEKLEMNKVYLTARTDNKLAIHIYKKLGFQEEGVMRSEYWVQGNQYVDLLRMSILRGEWLAGRLAEVLSD